MKKFTNIILTLIALISIINFSACNKSEVITSEEVQLKKLKAKTWQLHAAKVNGVDHTALYAGLTITFSEGIFVATNGRELWPATGTWTFANPEATLIERGDGILITIEKVDSEQLSLSMAWSENAFGPGRVASIAGQHMFDFK